MGSKQATNGPGPRPMGPAPMGPSAPMTPAVMPGMGQPIMQPIQTGGQMPAPMGGPGGMMTPAVQPPSGVMQPLQPMPMQTGGMEPAPGFNPQASSFTPPPAPSFTPPQGAPTVNNPQWSSLPGPGMMTPAVQPPSPVMQPMQTGGQMPAPNQFQPGTPPGRGGYVAQNQPAVPPTGGQGFYGRGR